MSFFEIFAFVGFVIGLVNAFFLFSLSRNIDQDLYDLDYRKADRDDLDAHKKVVRQSLDVLREDHRASMKRMQQKFNVDNAKVSRKKKARVVFFDHVNEEKGAENE